MQLISICMLRACTWTTLKENLKKTNFQGTPPPSENTNVNLLQSTGQQGEHLPCTKLSSPSPVGVIRLELSICTADSHPDFHQFDSIWESYTHYWFVLSFFGHAWSHAGFGASTGGCWNRDSGILRKQFLLINRNLPFPRLTAAANLIITMQTWWIYQGDQVKPCSLGS